MNTVLKVLMLTSGCIVQNFDCCQLFFLNQLSFLGAANGNWSGCISTFLIIFFPNRCSYIAFDIYFLTPCKSEQPLQNMKFQKKETQKD